MAEYLLIERIIERSESKEWSKAVLEWDWVRTFFIDPWEEPERCLCSHYPIWECCIIRNRENGIEALVGNCCINKFLDTDSDLIFQALKRVRADITKSLNDATIKYAHRMKLISSWEFNFYQDIMRKKKLTYKQGMIKIRINRKVLKSMSKHESDVSVSEDVSNEKSLFSWE